jgi:hypothetical protein
LLDEPLEERAIEGSHELVLRECTPPLGLRRREIQAARREHEPP